MDRCDTCGCDIGDVGDPSVIECESCRSDREADRDSPMPGDGGCETCGEAVGPGAIECRESAVSADSLAWGDPRDGAGYRD